MNEALELINIDEQLGQEVPAPLRGTRFAESYSRDERHHRANLPSPPDKFLQTLAENAGVIAEGCPSIFFFGGGQIGMEDYEHGVRTSGRIASAYGKMQSATGSGPGIMEAAHVGPTRAINGNARNVGVTLEGLVHKEAPGVHNDELVTLFNMARRLGFFWRFDQGGVTFKGGIGSLEEIVSGFAILLHPKNKGLHYPFVLSEPEKGEGTYMHTVMRFLEKTVGTKVHQHFTLHQGDSTEGLEAIMKLEASKTGHWHSDLHLPSIAFYPFKLDTAHIQKIDLTAPQDDPVRFLGHVRWFMNLLVQLIMIDREGKFLQENGIPQVRASHEVVGALMPVLDMVWREGRVKTDKNLDELVQFNS
ncbi:MAG: LOG family protein [Candidatus Gracilibacteria bacterium]